VSSFFILLAWFFYDIMTYLAVSAEGLDMAEFYSQHGLFPFKICCFKSYLAIFLYYYLGFLLTVLSLMCGIAAVAIIDFEDIRGNPFMSITKAVKFSLKRLKQIILAELAISVFIGFIILLGIVIGLFARIPVAGDFIYSIFFFFPNFIVALLTTLAIFILVLSVLVLPSATAADRLGETFNPILETFLILTRQPIRWLGYTIYSLGAAKICSFIFAYFAFRAVQLIQFSTEIGGGDKIGQLIGSGAAMLPLESKLVTFTNNIFPGVNFGFDVSYLGIDGTPNAAGYIMAISLFLIFLIIWGYILSVIATGQAYSYAVIKKIRDDNKIGDEQPLFFKDEPVNPPINETDKSEDEN
jgi:hypothetical protein